MLKFHEESASMLILMPCLGIVHSTLCFVSFIMAKKYCFGSVHFNICCVSLIMAKKDGKSKRLYRMLT